MGKEDVEAIKRNARTKVFFQVPISNTLKHNNNKKFVREQTTTENPNIKELPKNLENNSDINNDNNNNINKNEDNKSNNEPNKKSMNLKEKRILKMKKLYL